MLRLGLMLNKALPGNGNKLEYFRKKILDHLSKLEKQEETSVKKAMAFFETLKKAVFPIGTIRTWNGKKYIKTADTKNPWKPKYDSHTRGAKMAISALKKRVTAAKDENEMMQLILLNRDRFDDQFGHPLPFVQELHAYIEEQKTVRENVKKPTNISPLQQMKELANKITEMKKEAVRTGANKVTYENGIGGTNTEYYHSGRWNDRPSTVGEYKGEEKAKKLGIRINARGDSIPTHNLKDNIHTIFHGSEEEKEKLKGEHFHLADTPQFMKELKENPLRGEHFTARYGVITRHKSKDEDHDLTEDEWLELCEAIKTPFVITAFEDGHNIFTEVKHNGKPVMVGVELKGKRTEVNAVKTAFGADKLKGEKILYISEKITPEQELFIGRTNSANNLLGATSTVSPEPDEKSSSFEAIQAKYRSAKVIEGDEDEVQIGKDTLSGKWKLVEADTPTASHDEATFHKTPGFPTNADGSTINDRDYGHDKAAQEAVINIGSEFDGRALKFDNPVVVTSDGIVISGNNRTMSSKIAAKKGTDSKYIEALKKRAKKFGFTPEQIGEFKNPRVVFEVEKTGNYSTEEFAKFNESGKKEMGPTEKAVKVSKLIKTETVESVAAVISSFDTMGELYQSGESTYKIIGSFTDAGLIGQNETGRYWENGHITEDGKTFIETALLGSVMNEANIRGFNRPGCKSIRATLVRAITPLIENKSMTGYSINKELNEAVDIAMQVAINRDKFKSVSEFALQQNMFEKVDRVSVELAKKLEGTQKAFSEFMQKMNGSLKYAANGEADIFLGDVESKEDILGRFLEIKKAVIEVLNGIRELEG